MPKSVFAAKYMRLQKFKLTIIEKSFGVRGQATHSAAIPADAGPIKF